GLFGFPVSSVRQKTTLPRAGTGIHPRSRRTREKAARHGRTLFDFPPIALAIGEPQPPTPEETLTPAVPALPAIAETVVPPDLSVSSPEHPSPNAPFLIASG